MPGILQFFLAALAAISLSACTTGGESVFAGLDSQSQAIADKSLAAETTSLPARVDVTPASYAGRTPDGGAGKSPIAALFGGHEEGHVRRVEARSTELDLLIAKYARHYGLPVSLVRRVVKRESTFNPAARNGPYWGLMQIRHDTAETMGYRGPAPGLLDAETNLKYAVKYLRGAWLVAEGNQDRAVLYYASGYYYRAKKKGLLEETGLRG